MYMHRNITNDNANENVKKFSTEDVEYSLGRACESPGEISYFYVKC